MNRNCYSWSLALLALSTGCATASNSSADAGLGSLDTGFLLPHLDGGHDVGSIIIVQMDTGTTPPPGNDAGHDATLPMGDGAAPADGGADASSADASHPDSATPTDSSTPGSDSGAPTTCTQARGSAGCCAANGKSYYYCKGDGGTGALTHTTCTGTKVCGWNGTDGYYTCTATPADAGSANPSSCE